MLWMKGILLFTMVVMTLISSLRAGPGAFSETGAVYGAVSENTIRFGKLLIGAEGDQSIVPLSEMPARCGFSLKRARRDVSLVAPYQGCHVRLQDGSYVLPLLVMGAPVQMSCPASRLIPTVSCFPSSMTISLGVGVDVKVNVDGSWQPLLLASPKCSFTLETVDGSLTVTAPFIGSCLEVKDAEIQLSLMYGDREVTLSCPMTPMLAPTTIAPVQDPLDSQQMFSPFLSGKPWWYRPHSPGYPLPPTVPPMMTPPPLQDPNQHVFPNMYPMFDPYLHPSDSAAQRPRYPMFPPYMYPFKSPVEATTTPSTTTAARFEQFAGYLPMYPRFYGRQSFKSFVPPGVKYHFMP
ncbi:hypothetical protein DPX16_18512 [Anabarilius grahami]|uniref:Uncharacterized protein n=1 Tax=Anabarilius grahami TaxID=495550 RepID=A0A3N0YJ07_ANAGA|nr:hypothetical protein DPX16_18512 [Anabarilius grahami]